MSLPSNRSSCQQVPQAKRDTDPEFPASLAENPLSRGRATRYLFRGLLGLGGEADIENSLDVVTEATWLMGRNLDLLVPAV